MATRANETGNEAAAAGEVKRAGRRGILAAAALAVGALATKGVQPVAAGTTTDNAFVASGGNAFATGAGFSNSTTGYYGGGDFYGNVYGASGTSYATGVKGTSTGTGDGVSGSSASGIGVFGMTDGSGGMGASAGVFGVTSVNSVNAIGVQGVIYNQYGIGVLGGRRGSDRGNSSPFVGTGVQGRSDSGYGIHGLSDNIGVRGESAGGYAVHGLAASSGTGVRGESATGYAAHGVATGSGVGVRGESTSGYGVYATSGSQDAVIGVSTSSHGVYGTTSANPATRGTFPIAGIYGIGNGATTVGVSGNGFINGIGVYGYTSGGIGVYGISGGGSQPFGVVGSVSSAPGFALYGVVNVAGTVGFAAGAGVAGAIAGQFSGPVNIYNSVGANGNLVVQGTVTSSGGYRSATRGADGATRLVYGVDATEAWVEDFGTGTITGGKAEVKLDPDFVAVVDTSKLHVFCMPHDASHALHVAGTNATGFSVGVNPSAVGFTAGKKASDLSGTFTYRVVAKRKDMQAERLAKFTVPQEIKLAPPPIPPTPPDALVKPTLPPPPVPPAPPPKKG